LPEIISPSVQIRLSESYILTVWLSEDRSRVSWHSDTPLSHIILRCDYQEYIYDVGDYLGVTGLAAPNQETIREVGVLANPGSETPSEETPFLVLRDGNQLSALEARAEGDLQNANNDYEEPFWLLKEAVSDGR
jgi:hypothetical protein